MALSGIFSSKHFLLGSLLTSLDDAAAFLVKTASELNGAASFKVEPVSKFASLLEKLLNSSIFVPVQQCFFKAFTISYFFKHSVHIQPNF